MKNVTILPLDFSMGGFNMTLNPVAIQGQGGILLVDCGNPGFLPLLENAMTKAGLNPGDIRKIVITHHDSDHMGALSALITKYPAIEVYATAEQSAYITGKKPPLRLTLAEKKLERISDDKRRQEIQAATQHLRELETIDRVTVVEDGTVIEDFNVRILETSGHMPGHLSVYIPEDKALVTGDALTSLDGQLKPPDARYTLDMPAALASAEKLQALDIENVICYHGGLVTENIKESLRAIVAVAGQSSLT